jgi:hypothetical protein
MSKKTRVKEVKEEEITEVDEESVAIEDVIIPVKELPKALRRRSPIYDRILDRIISSPKGSYKIDITWKNRKSVYQGLSKRIKANEKLKKTLKIRMLDDNLYLQKLE